MSAKFEVADGKILACLAESPRSRYSDIGKKLGFSPDFVTSRIRSMTKRGHLRVKAYADARVFGYHQIVRIKIRIIGADAEALARRIASDGRFLSVELTTGEHQISALLGLSALDKLPATACELLVDPEGVTAFRCDPIQTLYRCEPGGSI